MYKSVFFAFFSIIFTLFHVFIAFLLLFAFFVLFLIFPRFFFAFFHVFFCIFALFCIFVIFYAFPRFSSILGAIDQRATFTKLLKMGVRFLQGRWAGQCAGRQAVRRLGAWDLQGTCNGPVSARRTPVKGGD